MQESDDRLAFCSLGMFIIDEIEHLNSDASEQRIIGGAGTFAALGARLAAGIQNAQYVGWIVDMGFDFPPEFKDIIDTWHTKCVFRLDETRLTTTAWNGYGPNEHRAFKYLTTKLRLDEHSLSDEQALSRSFHMVCAPQRCMSLVKGIMSRRRKLAPLEPRPIFVWEPVPDMCTPEELQRLREAIALVDVVSPNAEELASFFSSEASEMSRQIMVKELLALDTGGYVGTALVVREGALGCTTYIGNSKLHLHALHRDASRVRDPTGGGNTFLGALAMGMTGMVTPSASAMEDVGSSDCVWAKQNMLLGLVHATVAAAYAIEQVGMPTVSARNDWNGAPYQDRFDAYLDREKSHIITQIEIQ